MYVILVYDISEEDNGRLVLNRVFKICKRYLTHIQNSVFEGDLSKSQLIKLKYELKKNLRADKDSVIVFKSRNSRWLDKEMWALKENQLDNFI